MIYLCTDRARKKVFYTTNFSDMKEDVNCETLISQMTPAYPIIKDKVEFSEYEKKYVPYVDKIHESYDDILEIRKDGVTFRSQICRLLPSSVSEKEHMDLIHIPMKTLDELRITEEKQFVERKEEVEKYIANIKEMEDPNTKIIYEDIPQANMIDGHRLGKFIEYRKLYKEQGIYIVPKYIQEAVTHDPLVAQQYDDFVRKGMFNGNVVCGDEE